VYFWKQRWRFADVGFWVVLGLCVWDLWHNLPLFHHITWLGIQIVLVRLNELEDSIAQTKRKRYVIAKLRPLRWTELTPQQQAWIKDTEARHRSPPDKTVA
jgi:hypothetical protein